MVTGSGSTTTRLEDDAVVNDDVAEESPPRDPATDQATPSGRRTRASADRHGLDGLDLDPRSIRPLGDLVRPVRGRTTDRGGAARRRRIARRDGCRSVRWADVCRSNHRAPRIGRAGPAPAVGAGAGARCIPTGADAGRLHRGTSRRPSRRLDPYVGDPAAATLGRVLPLWLGGLRPSLDPRRGLRRGRGRGRTRTGPGGPLADPRDVVRGCPRGPAGARARLPRRGPSQRRARRCDRGNGGGDDRLPPLRPRRDLPREV